MPSSSCPSDSIDSIDSPRLIEVVCALMEVATPQGKKVWAAQRNDPFHAGQWEFPGGKQEAGESPRDALIREIKEELDCDIRILEALPVHDHDYGKGRHIRLIPFLCEALTPPVAKEHAELRLVSAEECASLHWAAADIPIVKDWQAARSLR